MSLGLGLEWGPGSVGGGSLRLSHNHGSLTLFVVQEPRASMRHGPTTMTRADESEMTVKDCASAPAPRRGALKRRCPEQAHHKRASDDEDALSSASTPPPEACTIGPLCKRACAANRRVCISSTSGVRYIKDVDAPAVNDLGHTACRHVSWPGACAAAAETRDDTDDVEETKLADGPAPEAVIVDRLVRAVTSSCDATSVCPILKAMVTTGATDLMWRVHARLTEMRARIGKRGKVSMLSTSSSLGADASPLLHFLLESVSRSTGLVETFCDRSLSASAADHSDLSHAQHTTAAAMALIADLAAQGSTSLNTCPASRS